MGCYRARRVICSETHSPRLMVDGDFACLHAELLGGDYRQLGTIYHWMVRCSGCPRLALRQPTQAARPLDELVVVGHRDPAREGEGVLHPDPEVPALRQR